MKNSHKTFRIILFVVICCVSNFIDASGEDYYWRDYTGEIPDDAYIGGKDINGKSLYIGQAYVKDRGIIVVEINPGENEVIIPISGIKKTSKGIKILCTRHFHQLKWVAMDGDKLHLELIGKHAVIGGLEDDKFLHIGRISREGSIKIGKVLSWGEPAIMYYVIDEEEDSIKTYEILLYDKTIPLPDPEIDIRDGEQS